MADDKAETALARPMIASELDKAGKGQLVYVGRDGEVKNPARVRTQQMIQYVAFGGISAAGVMLAATSFPVLVPFYLALGGRFLGTVRAVKRVNEAEGDAARFNALLAEYAKAPEVTRRRIYIETLQEVLPSIRSQIIVDERARQLLPLLHLEPQKGDRP